MLRWLQANLTYANVVSSVALFLALGGGVAWAALARNSVGAKQIQRNAVRSDEILRNAVGASEIKDRAVSKSEVKDGSVRGIEVKDDSLSALDIDESTLEVPFARADNTGSCDPNVALPGLGGTCASVEYTPPKAGPVLIVAQVAWHTSGDTAPSHGVCQMVVDGVPVGESMFVGELGPTEDTDSTHPRTASGTAITDTLQGAHTFSLVCSEDDANIDVNQAAISTVLLGTG